MGSKGMALAFQKPYFIDYFVKMRLDLIRTKLLAPVHSAQGYT
jgi:hypothetical protein